MKLIIIAAGQGSRIRAITDGIPKTLLRIKGKSLLDRVLENAFTVGIEEEYMLCNHDSGELIDCADQIMKKLDVYISGETMDLCIPTLEFAKESQWYSWFNKPRLSPEPW